MAEKKYSPFQQEVYNVTKDKPAGQLLWIAKRATDLAISKLGQAYRDDRETAQEIYDLLDGLLEKRKTRYLRSLQEGPAEIELPAFSTSADAGKVA